MCVCVLSFVSPLAVKGHGYSKSSVCGRRNNADLGVSQPDVGKQKGSHALKTCASQWAGSLGSWALSREGPSGGGGKGLGEGAHRGPISWHWRPRTFPCVLLTSLGPSSEPSSGRSAGGRLLLVELKAPSCSVQAAWPQAQPVRTPPAHAEPPPL